MNSDIALILKRYKTSDKFLGYKAAASFESDIVRVVEAGLKVVERSGASLNFAGSSADLTFADFKKIYSFLESNTMDDSATGMEYLYEALNRMLKATLTGAEGKHWKWVKEHLMCETDDFLETVLSMYTADKYQAEIMAILEKIVADDKQSDYLDDADEFDDAGDDEFDDEDDAWIADELDDDELLMELYRHSAEYYVAVYMRAIGSADYEDYLDKHSQDTDIKLLKKDLLISRGDKEAAFNLIKDEPECVLEAAKLLEGEAKEQYLFSQVLDGKETVVGQRRLWWDRLCEEIRKAGNNDKLNDYMTTLLNSPKHCEMVNWRLYEMERFEELKNRIDTGWIYDDLWGRLNNDCSSKYNAIKGFKKLKKVYPEWCAQIMIDYAVFMMDKNMKRQSYKMSAQTIAAAGMLSSQSMKKAEDVAKKLVEKHPKRMAMIEELKKAGLV